MAKRDKRVSRPGLLNDILFKMVFGTAHDTAVLRHLLNALLHLNGEDRIAELKLLDPSPERLHITDKAPILDLRARDEKGAHYNVEVQVRGNDATYIKRSLYYLSRLYTDQLKAGHKYHSLERSVSISILDFVLFPQSAELQSVFTLWDRSQDLQLTKDFELHYIELPKFRPEKPKLVQTRFERWLYVLKFSDLYHDRELPDNIKEEEGIQMAIDSMRNAYSDDYIRAVIEAEEKAKKDAASDLYDAERKGLREGLRASLINVLTARFGSLPDSLSRKVEATGSTETLNRLTALAATAETLEEFEAHFL